jgi:hypothetical protein
VQAVIAVSVMTCVVSLTAAPEVLAGGTQLPLSHAEAPWPRPDHPMARSRAAGLTPTREEKLLFHVHSHLDVFVDGKPKKVPLGIGLKMSDLVRRTINGVDAVGFFSNGPCPEICVSPLHTHDASGIIHTESERTSPNTLGEFFIQWGVRLTKRCVGGYCEPKVPIAVYLDGVEYTGDIRDIKLTDQLEIALVIGKPPATIPSEGDFSTA